MKTAYLIILKFVFTLLNILSNFFNKESIVIKYKIAIGILILTIQGYESKAQIDLIRGKCYRKGPSNTNSIDISVTDRIFPSKGENTIMFRTAVRQGFYSPGLSLNYNVNERAFKIGPYFRLYPFEHRIWFLYFIEINYQFSMNQNFLNEFNTTSGLVFFHNSRYISIEVACQYTTSFTSHQNYFMPVVGIHYFFPSKNPIFRKKTTNNL